MALAVVGTPQDVSASLAGADPAGFSVTVETGSNAVSLMWAQWPSSSAGSGVISTATLNGVTYDEISQIGEGAGDETATGIVIWYDIPAGSRTLDIAWTNAPSEGPVASLTCVSDADTNGATDIDQAHNTGASSVTLTTVADDLVLKHAQEFNATPGAAGGSWSSLLTGTNASEGFRLESIVATGTSQVCPSGGTSYTTVVAVAFSEGGGGGRTTKNTDAWNLGVNVGMGFRMAA